MKNYIVLGMIGLLLILVIFQSFQINGLKNKVIAGSSGSIDMSGWTEDEIMNYEMHGIIPTRAKQSIQATPSTTTMVGGC